MCSISQTKICLDLAVIHIKTHWFCRNKLICIELCVKLSYFTVCFNDDNENLRSEFLNQTFDLKTKNMKTVPRVFRSNEVVDIFNQLVKYLLEDKLMKGYLEYPYTEDAPV